MVKFKYCLFDLDGTLTDPKEGITRSVQYALRSFGIEEPDLKKLEGFIGPPLRTAFRSIMALERNRPQRLFWPTGSDSSLLAYWKTEFFQGYPLCFPI